MFISRKEYERLKEIEYQSMTADERFTARCVEITDKHDKFMQTVLIAYVVIIALIEIVPEICYAYIFS